MSGFYTQAQLRQIALNLALKRLSSREHSTQELEVYLQRRDFPEDVIASVLASLTDQKLLDDRRYAREVAHSQAVREKGPNYILQKLRQKGVQIELDEVNKLYSETSNRDELEAAQHIVERRYSGAQQNETILRRAYAALLRRGFSHDIARKALGGKIPSGTDEAESF
jgi:regulatory protein